jgi:hypothetical protein
MGGAVELLRAGRGNITASLISVSGSWFRERCSQARSRAQHYGTYQSTMRCDAFPWETLAFSGRTLL